MLPHAARCSCVLQPVHRMKLLPICAVNLVSRTALGSLRLHSSTETHKSVRRMTSASKVSAAQSLRPPITGLEKIQNIRDLAEASCKVQPGRIFRSACPNVASTSDIILLRKQLGVQQLIDLRSAMEREEDASADLLIGAELMQTGKLKMFEEWEAFSRRTALAVDENTAAENQLVVHHVGLLEKTRYFRSLLTRLPRSVLARSAVSAVFSRPHAKQLVLSEVNRGGLPLLYEIVLESATNQLCTVLRIITRSAERGQPVLFFCKLGKDRTGITAALVLTACGASEEEILDDYTRSDAVKGIALGGLEHTEELKGLDHAAFSAAPREAMATCLEYIRSTYGSLTQYLDYIGFSSDDRDRLQAALGNERPA